MGLLDTTLKCPAAKRAAPASRLNPPPSTCRGLTFGVTACVSYVSSRSNWIEELLEYSTRRHSEHARSFRSTSSPNYVEVRNFFPLAVFFGITPWSSPLLSSFHLLDFSPRWWLICCLVGRADSSSAETFPAMALVPSICSFASLRCCIPRIPASLVGTLCDDACWIKNKKTWLRQPLRRK